MAIKSGKAEILLLLHGIRTRATWQSEIKSLLLAKTRTVIPLKYEYFDVIRFLIPGELTRRGPVNRFASAYREVRETYPEAKISIIAHSFGTYIVSRVLERNDCFDIKLDKVILCGCIVNENFNWELYKHRCNWVVNEQSYSDIWPLLADSVSFGYGASGRYGFGHSCVDDRCHGALGHSDFLTKEFVETYWVPFFNESKLVPPPPVTVRTSFIDWLHTWLKLKYVMLPLIALFAVFTLPTPCERWIGYPICFDRDAITAAERFLSHLDRREYAEAYMNTLAGPAQEATDLKTLVRIFEKMRSNYDFGKRRLEYTKRQDKFYYHVRFISESALAHNSDASAFEYVRLFKEAGSWKIGNYFVTLGSRPTNLE